MESLGASSQLSMEKHVLTRLEAYSTEQTESCSSHQGRMQGLSKLEEIGGRRLRVAEKNLIKGWELNSNLLLLLREIKEDIPCIAD